MKVFGVLVLLLVAVATVNAEYTFVRTPTEAVVVEADVVGAKKNATGAATGAATGNSGKHLSVFKEDAPEVVSEKAFENIEKEQLSITGTTVLKGFEPEILDAKVKKHLAKKDQKKAEKEKEAGANGLEE